MPEKTPMGIPIRFVGPTGEELSLGVYIAVRKDALDCLEGVVDLARLAQKLYHASIGGVADGDEVRAAGKRFPAEMGKLKDALEALDSANRQPTKIGAL